MIQLKGDHLWFTSQAVEQYFSGEEHINWVYFPDRQQLLIARRTLTFFEKLHKPSWAALKLRNLHGDRTLDIRMILMDNDLEAEELAITHEFQENGLLRITFH